MRHNRERKRAEEEYLKKKRVCREVYTRIKKGDIIIMRAQNPALHEDNRDDIIEKILLN